MTSTTWAVARVLRDRDAGLYLAGVLVSGLGSSAMWLVAGVWVKDLTGSDAPAALCAFVLWAPLLAGPVLGTLADQPRRRALLITTDLALAALLLTLLAVDAPGDLWLLYAVLLVYGTAGVVHDAAESALVATTVDPSLLGDFNGLRMTANEGMKLPAPLAGAGLYAAYGGATVALLDAVSFVAAAGLYGLVRERAVAREEGGDREQAGGRKRDLHQAARSRPAAPQAPAPQAHTTEGPHTTDGPHTARGARAPGSSRMTEDSRPAEARRTTSGPRTAQADRPTRTGRTAGGVRHLLTRARLRPLVLAGGATMLLSGINGSLVFAVVEALGRSPAYAGLLHVAQGAGSIAVGLATGPLLRRLGERRFAAYGIALTGVAVALRAVPDDTVVLVCGAAIGAGLPCVLVAALTAVQRDTPPHLLGRATAAAHTLLLAPTAVGIAIGAALVGPVGLPVLSVTVGAVSLLPAAALLRRP
ncbi:MFS transporter [Streptomyces akebiae]|uniref:MFS transporter n=2 Tax=Streptomyces akebiae TaxID=2865673 RepID=A0ABX8Y658_9ACTN|nr:MFS transporter [Streptomyces akebiae]